MTDVPRIVFLTESLDRNSLGRTYCLWELAEELGWESHVLAPRGTDIWSPLAGTPFSKICHLVDPAALNSDPHVTQADVIVAGKPLPQSFGHALQLRESLGIPLVVDIDDPDLELRLSWERPIRRIGKEILRRSEMQDWRKLRAAVRSVPEAARIVSNPVLQEIYAGSVIPHVRRDRGPGAPHTRTAPVVAFVGTNRGHKGLPLLREAVRRVQDLGYALVVTDGAPEDSQPWESWIGNTTIERGMELVAESDVVIIPSDDRVFTRGQLPAKLVDAMFFGRAIGVSAVEPLPWALSGAGRVFKPGSVDGLVDILREFADPSLRRALGDEARLRAREVFSVKPNAAIFRDVVLTSISVGAGHPAQR